MINRLPKIPNRPKKSDKENAIELAEILHDKQCHWNHTDGCSWYYSSWVKPCGTRTSYLEKHIKCLLIITYLQLNPY
jgi:hypothetical protein